MFKIGDRIRMVDNTIGYTDIPVGFESVVTAVFKSPSDQKMINCDDPRGYSRTSFARRWELAEVKYTPTQEGDREDDI